MYLRNVLEKDVPHHLARRAEKRPRRRAQPNLAARRMPRWRQHPELQLEGGEVTPRLGQRPPVGLAMVGVQALEEQAGVGDQVGARNPEIIPGPGADELEPKGAVAGHHPAQKHADDIGRHGHQQALVQRRVAAPGKRRGQGGPQPGTTTRLRHQDHSSFAGYYSTAVGFIAPSLTPTGLRGGCSKAIATNW